MYTTMETASFQRQAMELKLKYPAVFVEMTPEKLADIANGYGPEAWGKELRKIVSWVFRKYPIPAAIHDVRYEFSDGRELTRKAADAEFSANLRLVWLHNYGSWRWVNPMAWFDLWKINTAARLTAAAGRGAWRKAYLRNRLEVEDE